MLKPGGSFEDRSVLGRSKSKGPSMLRAKCWEMLPRDFTESVYLDVSKKGVAGNFLGKVEILLRLEAWGINHMM